MFKKQLYPLAFLALITSNAICQTDLPPQPTQDPTLTAKPDFNRDASPWRYPSEILSDFVSKNLDAILAPLDKGIPPAIPHYPHHGPGHVNTIKTPISMRANVTQLDQNLRSEYFAAPKTMQHVYAKAVAVTTELQSILNDRDKKISLFNNSRTTQPLSPLDKQRTKHQRKQARQNAHAEKNNFSTSDEQHWFEDCARYRQHILSLIDQVRIAERTAASTISLTAPLQVPLLNEGRQIGSITIPAGQAIQVEGITADSVTIRQSDQQHVIPISSFSPADLENIKAQKTIH